MTFKKRAFNVLFSKIRKDAQFVAPINNVWPIWVSRGTSWYKKAAIARWLRGCCGYWYAAFWTLTNFSIFSLAVTPEWVFWNFSNAFSRIS
jgi:hypothetical protein